MKFREFLDALSSVSGEEVNISSVREFLRQITDDNFKSILSDMPDTKLDGSIRRERNITKELAGNILAGYNRKYLIKYLKEDLCWESESKQRLCDAFKTYCPDINKKNVFNLVAEQFEENLDAVCKGEVKKKISISKANLKDIAELVAELQCVVEKIENNLFKDEKIRKQFWMLPLSHKNDKLEQLQEDFHKTNMKLQFYTKIYPELTIIDEIIAEADIIEDRLPTKTDIQGIRLNVDDNIKDYKCLLDELIKVIYNK